MNFKTKKQKLDEFKKSESKNEPKNLKTIKWRYCITFVINSEDKNKYRQSFIVFYLSKEKDNFTPYKAGFSYSFPNQEVFINNSPSVYIQKVKGYEDKFLVIEIHNVMIYCKSKGKPVRIILGLIFIYQML